MRRLVLKLVLLALPFAALALTVRLVDPYRYFGDRAAGERREWDEIASRLSPPLWKLTGFRRHPVPNILLGDSRMALLDPAEIASVARRPFANLAYGGGSLKEAIATFWLADRLVPLRSATLGVNLDLYNEANAKDRVSGTIKVLERSPLYLSDRLVLRTTYYDLLESLTGSKPSLGVPNMSRDEFWEFQLAVTARISYSNYRYPESYHAALAEIASHCREKGIALRFVVFPEHNDLAAQAARYGLAGEMRRMLDDLSSFGETIDLRDAALDADRGRFVDPYHFAPQVAATLIERVWGGPEAAPVTR